MANSEAGHQPALEDLVPRLERFYGPLPAPPADPFRCFVWEVLGTQTTPARRDAAYAALHRIPALTPDSVFRASRTQLVAGVALAGLYQEQRLSALLEGAARFRRTPDISEVLRGPLRAARRALVMLPRLGEGSIARLLLFAGGHCVVPVDRDVARLWLRLEGQEAAAIVKLPTARVRRRIQRVLPADVHVFRRVADYLRHHALQTCTDDPHCTVCPLAERCPAARTRTA